MRKRVEIATQAEMDALLLRDPEAIAVVRAGSVVARESSHVEAWESSHVEARGSSHVVARESSHVEAWESSHVEAWESSHVEARESSHVEAWESSHVVAWGSSHVVAWGSSHVEASQYVAVHHHSETAVVLGGVVIRVRKPTTAVEWCDFYGLPVDGNGHVILYKAVGDDYRSLHRLRYEPGTMVEAPDWDGGQAECGGGLHFSPHPAMALEFDSKATRFVACPVALEDIRSPRESDGYPHKVKARRVCGPIYEVDRDGKPVAQTAAR